MSTPSQDLQRLAPEKLTVTFSRSKILLGLGIAVVLHLVLMAATSVTYVRDTWIDPEGAVRRKAEKLAAMKAGDAKGKRPAPGTATRAEKPATGEAAPPKTDTTAGKTPEEIELAKRKGSRVVQDITAKAKTSDIPKDPDDLGIPIEDIKP